MISERVSNYTIIEKLGEGGMGEVYLAEDVRLGRRVALKFLPASYEYDPARRSRFLKEARAASALVSPNIAAIYDIGEHDGSMFLVMEYVEGELLTLRLLRGPLSVREAINVAIQIAGALDEAHSRGIIHRDIKSANLIITPRGLVKVLDFGIAKVLDATAGSLGDDDLTRDEAHETAPGTILGTASYMSPEQARGLKIDGRTDIFSLGVLLYEMVTGRRPFEGPTPMDVIALVLNAEPPAIRQLTREAPAELERIVSKALRKDVQRRYQSVKDLIVDLSSLKQDLELEARSQPAAPQDLSTRPIIIRSGEQLNVRTADEAAFRTSEAAQPTSSTASHLIARIKRYKAGLLAALILMIVLAVAVTPFFLGRSKAIDSIAVLPFANVGADSNAEYLSDGIAESIISSLSRLPGLKIISLNSMRLYGQQQADPQLLGRELGVRAVLMGRISRQGDSLLISAELVDSENSARLWGEQYRRSVSDSLALQEEISKQILGQLRLKLDGREQARIAGSQTDDAEAYDLYLKGRYYWNKRTRESIAIAIDHFEQALEKDPGYALAYAGLADCYIVPVSPLPPKESMLKAKETALKALEIDGTLAEAHASLGAIKSDYEWRWAEAEREYERALELNPGYAVAHQWYAEYLANMGRFDEAITHIRRAQELDPLSLQVAAVAALIYHHARDYEQAIEQCQKMLRVEPNYERPHFYLGRIYEQMGMYDEAIAELRRAKELSGGGVSGITAQLGHACAVAGRRDEALKLLGELQAQAKVKYVSPYYIAQIYAGLGEKDRAFELLERAYLDRSALVPRIKIDPVFDDLHSDTRFSDLVRRIGLEP